MITVIEYPYGGREPHVWQAETEADVARAIHAALDMTTPYIPTFERALEANAERLQHQTILHTDREAIEALDDKRTWRDVRAYDALKQIIAINRTQNMGGA